MEQKEFVCTIAADFINSDQFPSRLSAESVPVKWYKEVVCSFVCFLIADRKKL